MIKNNRLLITVLCIILLFPLVFSIASTNAQTQDNGPETLDVIIVMDNSDSNHSTDPQDLREHFTRALFHLFSADADFTPSRIGVIFFGTNAELWDGRMFEANELALPTIEFPEPDGYTVIDKPFRLAYETLKDNNSYDGDHASAVIYLTDGRPEYDEKPGAQTEEVAELFRRSEPWIKKLAESGTRVYIVSYAGGVTLQEERWQEFAEMTGGSYHEVESLDEATVLYLTVVMNALLGYNPKIALPPTELAPFETKEADIDVPAATNRVLIFALYLNPGTEVELHRPRRADESLGEIVIDSDADVLVRGGDLEDRDKIWRIDYPAEGTWTLVFRGGPSIVQAWYFFRAFDIDLIHPLPSVLQRPGDPLDITVRLADYIKRKTVSGQISKEYPVQMTLKVTEPLLSGITSEPIVMAYDPATGDFATTYTQSSLEGKYVLQFMFTVGDFTLAKREYILYMGYTPEIVSTSVQEREPNTVAGFQVDERLNLRVTLVGSENAAPPGTIKVQALIQSESGQEILFQNADFILEGTSNNIFVAELPPLDQEGNYSGIVWLTGSTIAGIDFGGAKEIQQQFEFQIIPYPLPELVSVFAESPSFWRAPIALQAEVRRYTDTQTPAILINLGNEDGPVESARLGTQQVQIEGDLLRFTWQSQPIKKLGEHTITVSLEGGPPDSRTIPVQIEMSPLQRIILIGLIVLVLALLLGLVVWLRTRPLAPVIVVGTIDIIVPAEAAGKRIALSHLDQRQVTIGRGADISLDLDPDITGVVAKLVGRIGEDRRTQMPPILRSLRGKNLDGEEIGIEINYNPLNADDKYRRELSDSPNGVEISIGNVYRLLYKYDDKDQKRAHNA